MIKYTFIGILLMQWTFLEREPGALRAVRELEQFKRHVQTL